jgi:hypothetical protein
MRLFRLLASIACILVPTVARGQDVPADQKLRVFFDCPYCDTELMRTEITWIDHMRDRADADVHVLVTRESTGGGGGRFTLEFIGLRQFTGRIDTLRHVTTVDATSDIIRRGLLRIIKLGLVPYVAGTAHANNLDVTIRQPAGGAAAATEPATPQNDPWNYWSFTIGLNGNTSGESSSKFGSYSGNLSANRTTEAWKFTSRVSGSYNEQTFEYVIDDSLIRTLSIRRSYNASTLLVKSLGPHLSAGLRAGASTSTFGNVSLAFNVMPAIEYNFIPYSESTRRSLILQYSNGMTYADYRELTLFDELEETRPIHTLSFAYGTRQPWGSVSVGVNGSQYLHDTSKYNAGVSGSTSIRLFRGFSFNVSGGYSRVRDQLAIAKRNLTEEEILLRQRQVATNYSYYGYFGISYRFGSIFNNIVNPRFGGVSGGEIFF